MFLFQSPQPTDLADHCDRQAATVAAALSGDSDAALNTLSMLAEQPMSEERCARVLSDRAALHASLGNEFQARADLTLALRLDPRCGSVVANQKVLLADIDGPVEPAPRSTRPTRIAFISLLFNWPSTGGGTVHTFEAAQFLQRAGFEVAHILARFRGKVPSLGPEAGPYLWDVGRLGSDSPVPVIPIEFNPDSWNGATIRSRFSEAIRRFDADYVLITSSWNTLPLLAEAAGETPYILRFAALEGICPLNNVRLLIDGEGRAQQCDQDQLSNPDGCRRCVAANQRISGGLHRAERALGGFADPVYPLRLRQAVRNARAVFAVNPKIADLLAPHANHVRVVPSGFDPGRFPLGYRPREKPPEEPHRILFAGLRDEYMKGFHVLSAAAELLWQRRQDFQVLVTGDPLDQVPPWMRCIGWQSQEQLPLAIVASDLLAFPTVAQEALGRSAVEAMGCGRPVVASRLGGLDWVVEPGRTGLLCTPGDPADLAQQMAKLLDDAALRERLGRAGREKFEREFTWDVILEREYFPVFGHPVARGRTT